jgi:hypothetical protein
VSHDPSRKSFLGKLAGFVAVAGFAPRLLAKPLSANPSSTSAKASVPFTVRSDSRAVARRADSV